MGRFILMRILRVFPVLLGLTVITFLLINLAPGDAAQIILQSTGREPNMLLVEALRDELGLEQPALTRYILWLQNLSTLDLGRSLRTNEPVLAELAFRLPLTLQLACSGLALTLLVAVPTGILSALYANRWLDHWVRLASLVGASLPNFWLGLLLTHLFAVYLGLLPSGGFGGISHLILPAITLAAGMTATLTRLTRVAVLDSLGQEFVRCARARGLPQALILHAHVLKHAAIPIVTALGTSLGHLIGGTAIVETLYSWPGLGKMAVDAIFSRDYPLIQAYVLFMGMLFVLINLLVDLSYAWLDPRIRWAGKGNHG